MGISDILISQLEILEIQGGIFDGLTYFTPLVFVAFTVLS